MTLRVVGAGFGRTGTASLKQALEMLLGKPCYHMLEVFSHPEHVPLWHQAALGRMPDWEALFEGYAAAVDWPAAAYWPELMRAWPDAIVLLSVRDPQSWWESASETILRARDNIPFVTPEWKAMVDAMFANYVKDGKFDRETMLAAMQANSERAKREVPANRLLIWQSRDGWEPICKALGVPVPGQPFPRNNTREDWRAREKMFTEMTAAKS